MTIEDPLPDFLTTQSNRLKTVWKCLCIYAKDRKWLADHKNPEPKKQHKKILWKNSFYLVFQLCEIWPSEVPIPSQEIY
jgi:hypothetical protein